MDWEHQGTKVALRGSSLEEGHAHFTKQCEQRHQVAIRTQDFVSGYRRGLKLLCTPQGAEELARRGGEYKGTCPQEAERSFLNKYHTTREAYLKRKVASLEREASDLKAEIENLKSQLNHAKSEADSCQSKKMSR